MQWACALWDNRGSSFDFTSAGIGASNFARTTLAQSSGYGLALQAHPLGTTINVPEADGGILFGNNLSAGSPTINIATGRMVTNAAGSQITKQGDNRIIGNGTFQNDGKWTNLTNRLLVYTGSPTFVNNGTFEMTEHDSKIELGHSAGENPTFQNDGTFEVNLPSNTNTATIAAGQTAVTGGTWTPTNPITLTQGALIFGPQGQTEYTDAVISSFFGPRNANSEVRLAGTLKNISITNAANRDRIVLAHSTGVNGITAHADGLTINVPKSIGGIGFGNILSGGSPTITIPTGRTATNAVDSLIIKTSGDDARIIGDGQFINNGEFEVENNRLLMYIGAPSFINNGVFEFSENGSSLTVGHNGTDAAVFNNQSDGVVRADLPVDTNVAFVTSQVSGVGTFINSGTVEVVKGELELRPNTIVSAIGGGGTSIDAGIWRIVSGADNSTLDIQSGGTSPGSIDTIGAGAEVLLSGTNSQFVQLSSTTLNVDGIFGVQDQQVYNLSTGLNMGAGSILEFGLEGIDEGGTLTTGIDVDGNVTFNGSQVDILDLGGLGAGTYRIMEFISASDLASLGDIPEGFGFSLVQGVDFLELNVTELPEPSSFLLLGLGALGLVRHTRRRRRRA